MGCAQSSNPIDEAEVQPARQHSTAQGAIARARGGRGQVDGNDDRGPHSSQTAIVRQAGSPDVSDAENEVQPFQQKGRPNRPIKALSRQRPKCPTRYVQFPPPWTRSILERQRTEFWDTKKAYGGDERAWEAIRSVCGLMQQGDFKTAQAVLNAADLNCPTGRLYLSREDESRSGNRDGVWDGLGVRYGVPPWVAIDPEDLVEEEDAEQDKEVEQASGSRVPAGQGPRDGLSENRRPSAQSSLHDKPLPIDAQRHQVNSATLLDTLDTKRRRKRGAGLRSAVRIRLSEGGRDFIVHFDTTEPLLRLIEMIQEECDNKRVYVFFLGKRLNEKKTLPEQGWKLGDLLQGFLLGPF